MAPQASVLIVGAGLGGLAAAIAIADVGTFDVTVIESAAELAEVGAGVQITPQTVRVLRKWGLGETLGSTAAEPIALTITRYDGTKVLGETPDWRGWMIENYGAPVWDLHRADMQTALWKKAESLGVKFHFGVRVKTIDCAAGVVKFTEREDISADLVVAADGLHGMSRACLLGRPDPPIPTGNLAYRIVLNKDQIVDPEMIKMVVDKPACRLWIGPHAHVVAYSLKAGRQFNVVLLVPDDLPDGVQRQSGDVEEMRALFKGWDPLLHRFLDLVDRVDKWKLQNHDGLQSWHHPNGKFLMIGDAVHPMLPYLAQGANSAVEDGAVLGEVLKRCKSKADIPAAIAAFEAIRKPRSDAVIAHVNQQRVWNHLVDGPEQEARDRLFEEQGAGKAIKDDWPSGWNNPRIWGYICSFDPKQAVDEHYAKVS